LRGVAAERQSIQPVLMRRVRSRDARPRADNDLLALQTTRPPAPAGTSTVLVERQAPDLRSRGTSIAGEEATQRTRTIPSKGPTMWAGEVFDRFRVERCYRRFDAA